MRMDGSWWERGMILGGWGIAALLGIAAIISLFFRPGGGADGSPAQELVIAPPPATQLSLVEAAARTPTATPRPEPTPKPAAPAANPLSALASTCEVLRSTANWQPNDREWFLANCLGGAILPQSQPEAEPYVPPAPGEAPYVPPASAPPASEPKPPTPTPVPVPSSNSATAISMAVSYLRNSAPITYDADPSGCTAIAAGAAWVTTCTAPLAGCGDHLGCMRTIGLCVTLTPPAVMSARSC